MNLWLVRHAQPLIDKGVCYGQLDMQADAQATLDAAAALAKVLPGNIFAASSPLPRCRQLADALTGARSVRWQPNPHMDPFMALLKSDVSQPIAPPALFAPVDRYCASFSKWWSRTHLLD